MSIRRLLSSYMKYYFNAMKIRSNFMGLVEIIIISIAVYGAYYQLLRLFNSEKIKKNY